MVLRYFNEKTCTHCAFKAQLYEASVLKVVIGILMADRCKTINATLCPRLLKLAGQENNFQLQKKTVKQPNSNER